MDRGGVSHDDWGVRQYRDLGRYSLTLFVARPCNGLPCLPATFSRLAAVT